MLFKYFYDRALAHASYLVGCQKTNEAVIIDPGRDIQPYLQEAAKRGMRIVGASDTHIHADYVSGARELADQHGVKLYLSDEGPAAWKYDFATAYDHQLLKEGDTFSVGHVEFKVMFTPGHTPESLSFILTDKGGGADQPMGIFTGDFVFVGSIGRPDLLEEAAGIMGTAEPGARDLFKSIARFKELPDYLQVWPAHGAGSACGKGLGAIPSSTVGYEKRFNPALQFDDEQQFVDYILSEQPEPPKYFAIMKRVNKEGPAVLGQPSLPKKMDLGVLEETINSQFVVDTGKADAFASAHVPGTVNIQPKHMAMWGGSLIDYEKPVYLITDSNDLTNILRIMQEVGMDNVAGYFDTEEVAQGGFRTASFEQVGPQEIADKIASGEVELVDVRGWSERKVASIPGSHHAFVSTLLDDNNMDQFLDDRTYVFQCKTGERSIIAASLAERAGAKHLLNLDGGIENWEMHNLPIVPGSAETVGAE